MFKNYIKVAFRSLWKNKTFGFLNISGLAIGIAAAALIFLWVEDELTYNDFFKNKSALYQVMNNQTYDGTTFTFSSTPGVLASAATQEIPGIKKTARTTWGDKLLFTLNDKNIFEKGYYVDSSFLTMFQLPFIKGSAMTAFSQLHSLVITEKMAEKFFGNTDVLGKTIKVNNEHDYVIGGVIKDLPNNITFKLEWLAPFKIYEDKNAWLQQWGNNGIQTFVEVQPNANIDAMNTQLAGYIESKDKDAIARPFIFPMEKWRLYNKFINGKEAGGRIKYVNLFSLIAWIIIIIACINFMNLATARSEKRAREVGVRKVVGAGRPMLMGQFIGESLVMSFVAVLFSVVLILLALQGFNTLVEKQLTLDIFDPIHLGGLLLIALVCGLVAGSYPAFYLSSFKPIDVLKTVKLKSSGSAGMIRKGLVILQFSISIILIICTILIYQQINHVKNRSLGYNKDHLIYTNLQGNMKQHFEAIRNDLLATGVVENASLSNNHVLQLGSNTGDFAWPGKDPSKQILITIEGVSPQYISTMGMQLQAGRDFYNNAASDSNNVIINETLVKLMGKKDAVGMILSDGDGEQYTVVGVIKDFIYNNMYSSSSPLILYADTSNNNFLTMRLASNADLNASLSKVEHVIKRSNPAYPFEYKFVDEQFEQLFKTETLIGKLAGSFAGLAIIISCLGLFGLAAYTAERKTKEIGIRKVLGASITRLAHLLSKEFLILVGVSCLLAFPVAWWLMNNWLQDYEYRVVINWSIFVLAGLLAIIIALLTVSFQAIKAALANPIKNLRTE